MTVRPDENQQPRPHSHAPAGVLAESVHDIEHGLMRDDPDFVRRMHRLQRAEVTNAITVAVLLVASAVLLTVGLATRSAFPWFAGALAFIAAFPVDGRHQRRLGRQSASRRQTEDR